ncbi:MAG: hypothetical protein R2854_15105 [Caldilineaceae bacterium]
MTGYGLALLFGKIGFVPGGIGVVEATMAVISAASMYLTLAGGGDSHLPAAVVLDPDRVRLVIIAVPAIFRAELRLKRNHGRHLLVTTGRATHCSVSTAGRPV